MCECGPWIQKTCEFRPVLFIWEGTRAGCSLPSNIQQGAGGTFEAFPGISMYVCVRESVCLSVENTHVYIFGCLVCVYHLNNNLAASTAPM